MTRPTVFICSPFGADLGRNLDLARMVCRALVGMGYAPFAPHLFYPWLGFEDQDPTNRKMGLECSQAWAARAQLLIAIVLDGIVTEGMRRDINVARKAGVPVFEIKNFVGWVDLLNKIEDAIAKYRTRTRDKKTSKTA